MNERLLPNAMDVLAAETGEKIVKETIVNYEPRFPCAIVTDRSGSTGIPQDGIVPIDEINNGLVDAANALREDEVVTSRLELALITFATEARVDQPFSSPSDFSPPRLTAGGCTAASEAGNLALDLIEDRLQTLNCCDVDNYDPWVILITDGGATSPRSETNRLRDRIRELADHLAFFAIGTEHAAMGYLEYITHPKRGPVKLRDANWAAMFKWIQTSLRVVSESQVGDKVTLDPISGWAEL